MSGHERIPCVGRSLCRTLNFWHGLKTLKRPRPQVVHPSVAAGT